MRSVLTTMFNGIQIITRHNNSWVGQLSQSACQADINCFTNSRRCCISPNRCSCWRHLQHHVAFKICCIWKLLFCSICFNSKYSQSVQFMKLKLVLNIVAKDKCSFMLRTIIGKLSEQYKNTVNKLRLSEKLFMYLQEQIYNKTMKLTSVCNLPAVLTANTTPRATIISGRQYASAIAV